MIRFFFYAILLLMAIAFEATLIQIPLTLTMLLSIGILEKRGWILFVGLVAGLLLDSLTFRFMGISSLFFLCVLFLLYLYGKKFEIQHIGFDIFFCFTMSSIYGVFFGNQQPFLGALIACICLFCLLFPIQFFRTRKQQTARY